MFHVKQSLRPTATTHIITIIIAGQRLFENVEAEQVDKNYPEKPLVSSAEQDAN